MKILAVSDEVVRTIYSPRIVEVYEDVDLVVGCGDLPYSYLEYITTKLIAPVVYVYGNHDKAVLMADGRRVTAPEGCISLEGTTRLVNGFLLGGLGGSMRYQPRAIHQYTEGEMRGRVLRLIPRLLVNRVLHGRFLDVFVTHSPAYGIHDGKDLPHRGFKSFLTLMRVFKPRYMLHGHQHLYRRDVVRVTDYAETTVINVYPSRLIEWKGATHDDGTREARSESIRP